MSLVMVTKWVDFESEDVVAIQLQLVGVFPTEQGWRERRYASQQESFDLHQDAGNPFVETPA